MRKVDWEARYHELAERVRMAIKRLDYSLADIPERTCDFRLWWANMDTCNSLQRITDEVE